MNSGCTTCSARALPTRSASSGGALRSALTALAGGALLLLGLASLVLPLPGALLIVFGLSLLGTRFAIARRWLESLQRGLAWLRTLVR